MTHTKVVLLTRGKSSDQAAAPPGADKCLRGSAATIERIMVAAEAEFAARGLALARVLDIAQAAGVTKQLVYHYFESKEELHRALLERISQGHVGLFDIDEYRRLSPEAGLRLFVSRLFSIQSRNGGHLINDLAIDGAPERRPRGGVGMIRDISACLGDVLQRGQAQGVFSQALGANALLLMINIVTNGAASSGGFLIDLIYAEPTAGPPPALEFLCADYIMRAVKP